MVHALVRFASALLALALLAPLAPAWAQTTAPNGWVGKGELGYVLARGNTDSSTLSGKTEATDTLDAWTNILGGSVLRADSAGVTSANRYELHGQSNYKISAEGYVFGGLRFEHDDFSSFAHQAIVDAGYGYKFVDTPDTKLAGELGLGYRRSKVRLTQQDEGDGIVRAAMNYEHAFNAATKVLDKFGVESGSNDTLITNDLALQVKMSDRLALSLDYSVRHHSTISGTTLYKTDQLTTANLVFSF